VSPEENRTHMTATSDRRTIPVIDLSPFYGGDAAARVQLAREVHDACSRLGFLVVTGHGVDQELVDGLRDAMTRYFALPLEQKMQVKMPSDAYRGYAYIGSESLAASYDEGDLPDLKESFTTGPVDVDRGDPYFGPERSGNFFAENLWPSEPAGLEEVWSRYYREMSRLAGNLMRVFALALDLPEHFFDDKIDRHITNMSVIHYPPLEREPLPGQLRGGPHTDFGSLTILQRDDAPGGLQVQIGGEWVDAPFVPDSFVINLGDLMAEWTNDRWVSTVHRVVPPPTLRDGSTDRMSIPFFHQPNYDALIEVLPSCITPDRPARYEPVTSGDHIFGKIAKMRSPELGDPAS
jgi:isopenicillin N synthase-like dioxygenase